LRSFLRVLRFLSFGVGGFIALLLLVGGLGHLLDRSPPTASLATLPWQIQVWSPQATTVLGITLGETPLQGVPRHWPIPEIRLFVDPDGRRSLEAYYPNVRTDGLEAHIVLLPEVDDALLEFLWNERTSERPTPSGARRYGLSDAALRSLGEQRIREMSYAPRARWDAEQVRGRFGEPAALHAVTRDEVYWLYPERGLTVLIAQGRGRSVLHYATLAGWPEVLSRLDSARVRTGESDRTTPMPPDAAD
jgi:hypothetical protein